MDANKNPITPEEFSAKLMKMASERFMSIEILNDETNQPEKRIKMYFDGRVEGGAKIGNKGTLYGMVHSFAVNMYKDLYTKYENRKNVNENSGSV